MKRLFFVLRNKYILAFSVFLAFMLFFDRNDIFTQIERKQELNELEQSKAYYEAEIAKTKKTLSELQNNSAALEQFAREKYYMKKDNEDVFIVE